MKENKTVEFKERMTDTFLKTVSAYANYGGGQIFFGVKDDGREVGVEDPTKFCLNVENKINGSISPRPDFSLSVKQSTNVVILHVAEGEDKPYTFRGKAYRRSDTSSVEVDRLSYNRLVLEGSGKSFEELPSKDQELHFELLGRYLTDKLEVSGIDRDILRTLELYDSKNGFNIAAALLADGNGFPGIDAVRFGPSIDEIMDRRTIEGVSVLRQYEEAVDTFRTYYQYERIDGVERIKVELVPEKAFREAVANAIIHRTWDVNARIRIEMHPDLISVTSPGGLPTGISEDEYLSGRISLLRNPILGSVFFRLRLIEKLGTGVRRIRAAYKDAPVKPEFLVSENAIQVDLPVLTSQAAVSEAEQEVITALSGNRMLSSGELSAATGFSKDKVIRIVSALSKKGIIRTDGRGRGTRYSLRR